MIMKKILAILVVALMICSLAGCDSSKYKKAVELYDSGDYQAAIVIFSELGDYEDSAKYLKDAKWYALHDYIEKNGRRVGSSYALEKSGPVENYAITTVYVATVDSDPDSLIINATYVKDLGFMQYQDDCVLVVYKDLSYAYYSLNSEHTLVTGGKSGGGECSADGHVEIGYITEWTSLNRNSNFSSYSKDIYGNVESSYSPDETDLTDAQGLLDDLLSFSKSIIEETGLGITLADLGFTSYK